MCHKIVLDICGSEHSFECGENETVMDAMRRVSFRDIPRGCGGGGCGICKVRLISGAVRETSRMSSSHITEADRDEGFILACCASPVCDISLVFCGTRIGIAQKI